MKLQKILFPEKDYCEIPEMFFRADDEKAFDTRSKSVKLNKDKTLSFNTYFNSFSIGKWREYTGLSDLSLTLKYRGNLDITAYNAIGRIKNTGKYDIYKKELSEESYYAKRKKIRTEIKKVRDGGFDALCIAFPELPEEGILYVEIKAVEESYIGGSGVNKELIAVFEPELILAGGLI